MKIREYKSEDENGWVRCRLLSFLDSSYYDDIKKTKESYDNPSLCLVAEDNGIIVGFIDVEYEEHAGEVCYFSGALGAVIWNIGVLPEYRRQGVATQLWNTAKVMLLDKGIRRFEVWTQNDTASNAWYERQGFVFREAYLNAYIKGNPTDAIIRKYINMKNAGAIYGIRCFNFEAPIERKNELEQVCFRLYEVKVYELKC